MLLSTKYSCLCHFCCISPCIIRRKYVHILFFLKIIERVGTWNNLKDFYQIDRMAKLFLEEYMHTWSQYQTWPFMVLPGDSSQPQEILIPAPFLWQQFIESECRLDLHSAHPQVGHQFTTLCGLRRWAGPNNQNNFGN